MGFTNLKKKDLIVEKTKIPQSSDKIQLLEFEQKQIIQSQDAALDRIYSSVSNIKQTAVTINDEVTTQNKMLENTDANMSKVSDKLKNTTKKIGKLLNDSSDKHKIFCIIILTIILFILIYFLLK